MQVIFHLLLPFYLLSFLSSWFANITANNISHPVYTDYQLYRLKIWKSMKSRPSYCCMYQPTVDVQPICWERLKYQPELTHKENNHSWAKFEGWEGIFNNMDHGGVVTSKTKSKSTDIIFNHIRIFLNSNTHF